MKTVRGRQNQQFLRNGGLYEENSLSQGRLEFNLSSVVNHSFWSKVRRRFKD